MLLALAIVANGSFSDPAGVAESVDAPDSKSGFRKEVGVRVPPPAPVSRTVRNSYASKKTITY